MWSSFTAGLDSLVVDVDKDLLMRNYVHFILGNEHVDWMVEILVFDSVMQIWMMYKLIFLSPLEWKPLVKMKMVLDLSLDIKMCDTLFYLLGDYDARASWVFSVATLEFMEESSIVALEGAWTGAQHALGAWHGLWSLTWSLVARPCLGI